MGETKKQAGDEDETLTIEGYVFDEIMKRQRGKDIMRKRRGTWKKIQHRTIPWWPQPS